MAVIKEKVYLNMTNDVIHIALSINDKKGNYSKYTAAAIASVLKNTDSGVVVHLLTDDSVTPQLRTKFKELVDCYDQKIEFYDVTIKEDLSYLSGLKRVSAASLYRLRLPDILNDDIEKVIYLDSDIIVNLDIRELWDISFDDKAVMAVKDSHSGMIVSGELEDKGIFNASDYYNAGVMVWNLKKIREKYDLYNQAMDFFKLYGEYCNGFTDQHASNYIFKGDVKFLDGRYNVFTADLRGRGKNISEVIYHFASDKPDMALEETFDQLFMDVLVSTSWGDPKEIIKYFSRVIKARSIYSENLKALLKQIRKKRIVFWGAGSVYLQKITAMIDIDHEKDYCIDSNSKYWNGYTNGLKVNSIEWFEKVDKSDVFVIVVSKRYFGEISEQLDKMGLAIGRDYIDGMTMIDGGRRYYEI